MAHHNGSQYDSFISHMLLLFSETRVNTLLPRSLFLKRAYNNEANIMRETSMTKINCQKGQPMHSFNPFLILMQLLFFILFLQNEVGAETPSPCVALLHPLASNVDE